MRLFVILTIGFTFWSCPGKTTGPEDIFPIQDVQFNFIQSANKLYFAVQAEPVYKQGRLDSVQIAWYGLSESSVADTLGLDDRGIAGDIIAGDGIYALKVSNDTSALSNPVVSTDTGQVYLEVLAYYRSERVTDNQTFVLGNIQPRILDVTAPSSITLPTSGYNLVKVTSRVFDANGLDDIRWVGFKSYHTGLDSIMNKGQHILLYDDGGEAVVIPPDITSGDAAKGDGIYSFQAPLGTGSVTGVYHWIFEAQDLANAYSDTFVHVIEVKN